MTFKKKNLSNVRLITDFLKVEKAVNLYLEGKECRKFRRLKLHSNMFGIFFERLQLRIVPNNELILHVMNRP